MSPILLVGLSAALLVAGAVLAVRARARRRRRRWNERPDSVAAIAARVEAEQKQPPPPTWPVHDRDLRATSPEREQPTLRLPPVRTPQARPRAGPRPYLRHAPRSTQPGDADTTEAKTPPSEPH
ncbi:hypothetical protein [Saccharomonospora marina]|uniref:hypothetical protein n=1 Tax=Saccharomonospora marina TaxID=632569 RepID=UPI00030FE8A1|nr:hypothetical protein [Saccharomonospora marina]